jgi:peptidoglycan/xylan/chitin deacetylase (PgdA/CDA1 family)
MNAKHRKKRWSMVYSAVLTLLASAMVAAYLIAPGMWQWSHAAARVEAKKIHQVDTAVQPVNEQLVEQLRTANDGTEFGPVIITYHDIGYHEDKYTVTPENFAAQMRLIHDAGWTTLTSDQLDGWLRGELIPQKSVMITFDDGAMGVWRYADPVLAQYDMHAVAFIITGSVGTHAPYYMTWDQITDLQNSGRWDLEAHTHNGHVKIPSDPNGGLQPFMTTTQWLADQGRYETTEEYHARVYNDLAECQRQFALHGVSGPKFFAYPFSAHEDDPNDTDREVQRMVLSLYHAAVLDDSESTRVTSPDDLSRGMIRRMDINSNVTPDRFVQKIEEASST